MLYYRFDIQFKNSVHSFRKKDSQEEDETKINLAVQGLNEKQDYNVCFFISDFSESGMTLCAAIGSKNRKNAVDLARQFIIDLGLEAKSIDCREITVSRLAHEAHSANIHGYIDDDDDLLSRISIGNYRDCMSDDFSEEILRDAMTREEALEKARTLFFGASLTEEVMRIYADGPRGYLGHPVHYIIESNNETMSEEAVRLIASALISVGRLKSRRITMVKPAQVKKRKHLFGFSEAFDMDDFNNLAIRQGGGAIAVFPGKLAVDAQQIDSSTVSAERLAKVIRSNRRDTLSIIVMNKNDRKSIDLLKGLLPDMFFVEISEDVFSHSDVRLILEKKAREAEIDNIDSLLDRVETGKSYYVSELDELFEKWKEERLRTEVYTQYKDFYKKSVINEKPKGDAYTDLMSMVGLDKAKEIIRQAIDFQKVRKLQIEKGLPLTNASRHMVFTGNPGTAKTTVARLFAQIMKDNEVLPIGKLIEVGRHNLVGKYVGWTAQMVEEAFDSALGSVLFIDEAYSLCDDKSGMFGDEAINTIVQLMENRREDTIVILAGYPEKMEELLDRNPGLRSRIAFNVNFDDYNADELVRILHLMAGEKDICLNDGVDDRVRAIIDREMGKKDFGNGRFVRNLFERALMKQSSRIVAIPENELSVDTLKTLNVEDFDNPDDIVVTPSVKQIGFAC